jgi:hypothetical protein
MSIVYAARIVRGFNLESFRGRVEDHLGTLVARPVGPIEMRVMPNVHSRNWLEDLYTDGPKYIPGQTGMTGLEGWICGPDVPGHYARLRCRPSAWAVMSTWPAHPADPGDTGRVEVTSSHTASSVLLSIAAVVAAAELGAGTFTDRPELADLGVTPETRPDEVLNSLRLGQPVDDDLEEAARAVLLRQPAWQSWAMLHRPLDELREELRKLDQEDW